MREHAKPPEGRWTESGRSRLVNGLTRVTVKTEVRYCDTNSGKTDKSPACHRPSFSEERRWLPTPLGCGPKPEDPQQGFRRWTFLGGAGVPKRGVDYRVIRSLVRYAHTPPSKDECGSRPFFKVPISRIPPLLFFRPHPMPDLKFSHYFCSCDHFRQTIFIFVKPLCCCIGRQRLFRQEKITF